VLRKGSTKTLNITVGEAPNEKDGVAPVAKGSAKPEVNRLGLVLRELTPAQKRKLNGKNGLLVVDAQGAAAQAGIRRGDIVLGLNNTEVQGLEQFNKQLAGVASGKTVALLVQRDDNTLYVPLKLATDK
jgi:serine protease Do